MAEVVVMARCMKCRDQRQMNEPHMEKLKNGRDAVRGICPECGTKLTRMGQMPKAE